ncbi:hypothetical protein [Otariodibacter sp.]|uniref:hypothetical protein n=1 Tax=Otariodibacter sp. TaxID=3030919 RepID=UPI002612D860|nr:hypothetical protein [Otariodibacter sp.]
MKAYTSEYFYDPMRAFYDGGVDYLTVEKHRLCVIAEHAYAALSKISLDKNGDCPVPKEQINQDMDDLLILLGDFKGGNEVPLGNNHRKYSYELDYNEQIKRLDKILLKYVEFFVLKRA